MRHQILKQNIHCIYYICIGPRIKCGELLIVVVGLHLETKDPEFINSRPFVIDAGTTLEDLLLEALTRHGYDITNPREPVFLQSFDENSLQYMHDKGVGLPKVLLLSTDITDTRLEELSQWCYGIGPNKRSIVRTNTRNQVRRLLGFQLNLQPSRMPQD